MAFHFLYSTVILFIHVCNYQNFFYYLFKWLFYVLYTLFIDGLFVEIFND